MQQLVRYLIVLCVMGWGLFGCATQQDSYERDQEQLGLGIVLGTLGDQHHTRLSSVPANWVHRVAGQVLKVEGAAYVIRDVNGRAWRIPHDENTRIDRPAHVGDLIEAYLDDGHRALLIKNIDGTQNNKK